MTMAMDFFESQERAKRNTGVLVALFFVGVVATVVSVHLLLSFTLGRGNPEDPRMLLLAGGSVGAIVLIGTLVKQVQMSHGGRAVAEALGGRMVDPGSRDPSERKILNIVEEMAIASGMPVPPVYVMDDDAINAFAAGNSPKDAVIGVTAGCIRELDRAELQGVVAHEFSHIFHQDMRLNMRLVAW
ncbi:MAG: M48 family metalloprotease, partial [Phycisphaerales bacterium]